MNRTSEEGIQRAQEEGHQRKDRASVSCESLEGSSVRDAVKG